uniref:Putative secreted protein n=1 Tax=Panstrongylus lignarius TaxID=156445 RepID=A0A224Y537_9HEMI
MKVSSLCNTLCVFVELLLQVVVRHMCAQCIFNIPNSSRVSRDAAKYKAEIKRRKDYNWYGLECEVSALG